MRNLFTLFAGFLLFVCVYFHVKRQNSYLSGQPTPDTKSAMQASPVNTLATNVKATLAVNVAVNR